MENMEYIEDRSYYIFKNGKRLVVTDTRTDKSKMGYKSKKTCYTCEDRTNCSCMGKCIKGFNSKTQLEYRTKRLGVSKLFKEKPKEDLERILSDEGCELRTNRSIQSDRCGAYLHPLKKDA